MREAFEVLKNDGQFQVPLLGTQGVAAKSLGSTALLPQYLPIVDHAGAQASMGYFR